MLRDGVAVGQVTSGAWGETLGACVGLAYIRLPDGEVLTPDLVRAGEYQVNVGGRLHPAAVSLRPPFDPASDRVRGRYLSLTKRGACPLAGHEPGLARFEPRISGRVEFGCGHRVSIQYPGSNK